MKFIKNLEGYSGCKIQLLSLKGTYLVRKISKSVEYNERLKNQMLKQKYFIENLSTNKISAPKVINQGNEGELYYFDMQYIPADRLIDHICDSDNSGLHKVSQDLIKILGLMKNHRKKNESADFSKMESKISEVQDNLLRRDSFADPVVISELKKLVTNLKKPANTSATFCHGDLAMDNILYSKEEDKYYLIDFLDSYIDHYWLDLSKLYHDLEGRWYKLRNPSISLNNVVPKMNFISDYLNQNLIKNEPEYEKNHYLFLAVNLARVLPYADDDSIDHLIGMISKSMVKAKDALNQF